MIQDTSPNPLNLLRAAIRCDMAYMEPTWAEDNAQVRVEVVDGIQRFTVAGTNDKADVLNDVKLGWVTRTGLGVVRDGFADAWTPIRHAGPETFGLARDLPIFMEGHSLGVPLSQFQAVLLLNAGYDVSVGIGFGGPTGFDKDGGILPSCPWIHVKNGYDPVADRPCVFWPGTAGGKWWQIENGRIREGRKHPMAKPLKFWTIGDHHRLRGPLGYIYAFGAMCDAAGLTADWRRLPEAMDWARAVQAFLDRDEKPQVVTL